MGIVTKNMAGITKNLEKALAGNKLEQIAEVMQQFEKQFENLDLQTQVRIPLGLIPVDACALCDVFQRAWLLHGADLRGSLLQVPPLMPGSRSVQRSQPGLRQPRRSMHKTPPRLLTAS